MRPIESLIIVAVVVVAATVLLVVIMIIVIAGIRREEHELTMTRKTAPSPTAWLTRRIVGLYVRKTDPDSACCADPEQPARWYESSS